MKDNNTTAEPTLNLDNQMLYASNRYLCSIAYLFGMLATLNCLTAFQAPTTMNTVLVGANVLMTIFYFIWHVGVVIQLQQGIADEYQRLYNEKQQHRFLARMKYASAIRDASTTVSTTILYTLRTPASLLTWIAVGVQSAFCAVAAWNLWSDAAELCIVLYIGIIGSAVIAILIDADWTTSKADYLANQHAIQNYRK